MTDAPRRKRRVGPRIAGAAGRALEEGVSFAASGEPEAPGLGLRRLLRRLTGARELRRGPRLGRPPQPRSYRTGRLGTRWLYLGADSGDPGSGLSPGRSGGWRARPESAERLLLGDGTEGVAGGCGRPRVPASPQEPGRVSAAVTVVCPPRWRPLAWRTCPRISRRRETQCSCLMPGAGVPASAGRG